MKRLITTVIVLAMGLALLTSCGASSAQPTIQPTPVQTAEPSVPPVQSTDDATIKEFPLPIDGTVDSLSKSLEAAGYSTLKDPKTSSTTNNEFGEHTAYTYSLGEGAFLVLYVSDKTENVLSFFVGTTGSEVSEDGMKSALYLIGSLLGALGGDDSETLMSELGLDNYTETPFATADSEYAHFLYTYDADSIIFMVSPLL